MIALIIMNIYLFLSYIGYFIGNNILKLMTS
jgi:hypothetical protein